MKALKPCVFMLVALGALQFGASAALAAPQDNILQQQQILNKKEQEQASKRAEKDLQYRVSRPMAKTQQQGSRLEVFLLPEEEKSFVIKRFYLKAPKFGYKFKWINEYLAQFNGKKIGVQGINALMQRINTAVGMMI